MPHGEHCNAKRRSVHAHHVGELQLRRSSPACFKIVHAARVDVGRIAVQGRGATNMPGQVSSWTAIALPRQHGVGREKKNDRARKGCWPGSVKRDANQRFALDPSDLCGKSTRINCERQYTRAFLSKRHITAVESHCSNVI